MNNNLRIAPPPIGGWLILIACKLALILGFSLKNLLLDLQQIPAADPAALPVSILSLAISGVAAGLAVYAALLFFGRRREFGRIFLPLTALDTLSICLFFPYPVFGSLYNAALFLLPILYNAACAAYLLLSRRVKATFVFDRTLPDPSIRLPKDGAKHDGPQQIYGPLIVVGVGIIGVVHTAWSELVHTLLFESPAANLWKPLLFGAVLAAGIIVLVLFFRRKKLFRPVFAGLVGVCILHNVYFTYVNFASVRSNEAGIWGTRYFDAAIITLIFLFCAGLIVYTLVSKRVRRTFVHETSIRISGEKPVSVIHHIPRVKGEG